MGGVHGTGNSTGCVGYRRSQAQERRMLRASHLLGAAGFPTSLEPAPFPHFQKLGPLPPLPQLLSNSLSRHNPALPPHPSLFPALLSHLTPSSIESRSCSEPDCIFAEHNLGLICDYKSLPRMCFLPMPSQLSLIPPLPVGPRGGLGVKDGFPAEGRGGACAGH